MAASVLVACNRYNEAEMRDRLVQFFPLGQTLSFEARIDCTAAAFRLVDSSIGAEVSVEPGTTSMIHQLEKREIVAVKNLALSPDIVMIEAANVARDHGMAMRRTVLEARACMDDQLAREFGRLLTTSGAIFAYDRATASVMIVDQVNRVLVVARGSG